MPRRRNPSLASILKYRNPLVIQKFITTYGVSRRESETIFSDMLRFLWLSNRFHLPKRNGLPSTRVISKFCLISDWAIIDEMWHTFILFTSDYRSFCKKFFGIFIEHYPVIQKQNIIKSPIHRTPRGVYIDIIYDHLGQTVANRWFVTYPEKYTKKSIYQLQLRTLIKTAKKARRR